MPLNERVVVALSGTDADRPLIAYARLLAGRRFSRWFHFVHVRTPARIADDPQPDAQVQQNCEALVAEQFTDGMEAGWSCHVVTGVRIDALIEFISNHHCTVVLLGHRSSRSGQRSLARRLAMVAPCSVWLAPDGAPISVRRIMVPVDFSDHSAESLEVAVALARRLGVPDCLAVNVFSDPSTIRYDERIDELRRSGEEAFRQFLAPLDIEGVEVDTLTIEGNNVARTLLHVAKQREVDLLVMNTRGRSRSASILLGSVTAQVMGETSIAVLAVKHYGAMLNLFQALQQSQFWMRQNPKTN